MPRDGAYTLSEAGPVLEVRCESCPWRYGRYSRDRLLAKHGDIHLPHLIEIIQKESGCERAGDITHFKPCQARFQGAVPEAIRSRRR